MKKIKAENPDIYFHVYIGAIRTRFPFSLLHMSTDHFLRDALLETEDCSLNIKQVDLDSLPLPADFKVTFEHASDQHHEDDAHADAAAHSAS